MDPLDALARLLDTGPVVALTGAGCSTPSGIPDYGGLHSPRRRQSMRYQEFLRDPGTRARYWARSAVGWPRVEAARPNPAHRALAALEREGRLPGIITQNVDGLHQKAGSRRVVELHGSLGRVRCLVCGERSSRTGFQGRLRAWNPELERPQAPPAPDGDAHVEGPAVDDFRVPACTRCAGTVKPDVVFFGETVPPATVEDAWALFGEARTLLVVGSSLAVFSGFRFVQKASREGIPVAIVNDGPTRGDPLAAVKVEGRAETVLPALLGPDPGSGGSAAGPIPPGSARSGVV